jgi:hypothetical protein
VSHLPRDATGRSNVNFLFVLSSTLQFSRFGSAVDSCTWIWKAWSSLICDNLWQGWTSYGGRYFQAVSWSRYHWWSLIFLLSCSSCSPEEAFVASLSTAEPSLLGSKLVFQKHRGIGEHLKILINALITLIMLLDLYFVRATHLWTGLVLRYIMVYVCNTVQNLCKGWIWSNLGIGTWITWTHVGCNFVQIMQVVNILWIWLVLRMKTGVKIRILSWYSMVIPFLPGLDQIST